jgi:hypothetical protein
MACCKKNWICELSNQQTGYNSSIHTMQRKKKNGVIASKPRRVASPSCQVCDMRSTMLEPVKSGSKGLSRRIHGVPKVLTNGKPRCKSSVYRLIHNSRPCVRFRTLLWDLHKRATLPNAATPHWEPICHHLLGLPSSPLQSTRFTTLRRLRG